MITIRKPQNNGPSIRSDESKKEMEYQKGCGYCWLEPSCEKRDPKINKAKEGCKEYKHYLA